MTKELFPYATPFNNELRELNLVPYKTNKQLEDKIRYIYSHAKNPKKERQLFLDVENSGSRMLVRDMANIGIALARYFHLNPQQFNHNITNIHMSLVVVMWRQVFRHCSMQEKKLGEYHKASSKLLLVENNLLEELIRTIEDKDYIQHSDDMVKRRTTKSVFTNKTVGLRDRVSYGTHEVGDTFEYLASLE